MLQKSEPAPYAGILMPEEKLKMLDVKSLKADLYKAELDKHEGDIPIYVAPDGSLIVTIGVVSILVGFVIGVISR